MLGAGGGRMSGLSEQVLAGVLSVVSLAAASLVMTLFPSPASAQGRTNANIFYFRSVYAAFDVEPGEVYSVDVGGRYNILSGVTATQARGELYGVDDLYYFAYGVGEGNRLSVNDALNHAILDGTPTIRYCFNGSGTEVSDTRCPIGEPVRVHATFTSEYPMEYFEVRDESGSNRVRGRLADASATQNGRELDLSIYGEIVENFTTTRSG